MTEDESQLSVIPDSQEGGGAGAFDLSTSSLLPRPAAAARYDPVAQLLGSDSDSDDAHAPAAAKPPVLPALPALPATEGRQTKKQQQKKPRKPREKKKAREAAVDKDSVVGRMAAAAAGGRRRVGVLESSGSEDEAEGSSKDDAASQPSRRLVDLRIASSSSEDEDEADAGRSAEKKPKERAASKKALAAMHRETSRLLRETLVKIDPLEYTKRLELTDFFTRFSQHTAAPAETPLLLPAAAKRVRPLADDKPLVFRCTVDSDSGSEYEVEILDVKERRQEREAGLEGMLRMASQPMHVAGAEARWVGRKELSQALLGAVYRREAEELAAREQRRLRRSRRDEESEGAEPESVEAAAEAEAEEEEDDDEEGLAASIRRSQAALASDSDNEMDGDDEMDGAGRSARPPPASPAAKRKFLGMFRMPSKAAPVTLVPPVAPAAAVAPPSNASPASVSSQMDAASQDLSYMFSSQMDAMNTQDSLMMTPGQQPTQQPTQQQQLDEVDMTQPTQPFGELTQMGLGLGLTQAFGEEEPVTGERPPTQATQPPTQTTQLTEQQDDAGVMPTMVRRALGVTDGSGGGSDSADSGGNSEAEVRPRSRARLLHRRGDRPTTTPRENEKKKKGRRVASEFVAVEAELGTSSDSSSDESPSGRFAWGERHKPRARVSVSSDESSESSEDEEEALLNDPLIDDSDGSADDLAVRQLHREQALAADERSIHQLARDIATGALRTRRLGASSSMFALDGEEDYVDREMRAERMEVRRRMRRRLEAREIHEASMARIARNPETAAFARAALMRGSEEEEEEEMVLDEVLDEAEVARAVGRHVEGDGEEEEMSAEEEAEDSQPPPVAVGLAQPLADGGDDALFDAVPVEQLIVRRATLLKRPGAPLLSSPSTTRRKT
ncbi:hypothetical protein GGI15_000058 [Coemansia interrupta]|uniref:DNA replication checkpoint mediator MRC1 domain-containing protein n=1 Tax=Coemansia interrupta TaxID=1126814 RepID=A0A9W8HTW2_9FUNG|nr:hypothetical protein GGI15_000058 [Coemansia interrupta]